MPPSVDETVPVRRIVHLTDGVIKQLADVLIDCVEGGASVSFMHQLESAKAEAFWRGLAPAPARRPPRRGAFIGNNLPSTEFWPSE
jgi:hypothetical protein